MIYMPFYIKILRELSIVFHICTFSNFYTSINTCISLHGQSMEMFIVSNNLSVVSVRIIITF